MLVKLWSHRNSCSLFMGTQNETITWEFWTFLTKAVILLPDHPAITVFGIYPKELKTYVHTKTGIWTFITVLFITVIT